MPTYEFRCPQGHDSELFVLRISDAPSAQPCPTCGAEAQRRISAGGGLLFKGSGFYITDYGKDGKKDVRERAATASIAKGTPGAKGDTPAPAAADAPAAKAADAKPAASDSAPTKSGGSQGS